MVEVIKIFLIILMNLLICWCMYKDIKEKIEEVKSEFEESITGQVITFREEKENGIIRYDEEPNEVANYNSNI